MTPLVRSEIDINTSYGSKWQNFEQALRLIENGAINTEIIIDSSFSVDDPQAAFESFLNSKTCKPIFKFNG